MGISVLPNQLKVVTEALTEAGNFRKSVDLLDHASSIIGDGILNTRYLKAGERLSFDSQVIGNAAGLAAADLKWAMSDSLPTAAVDAINGAKSILDGMPRTVASTGELDAVRKTFASAIEQIKVARAATEAEPGIIAQKLLSHT